MERNSQIDFFKGFLLLLITFNHFVSENNLLLRITYEGIGWISGASGFVFLSGFTLGMVYSGKYKNNGWNITRAAAFHRARLIYWYHLFIVLLSIVFVISFEYVRQHWAPHYSLMLERPVWAAGLGALMLYQPQYMDILPQYVVYLLFVPLIIRFLHRGLVGQLTVIGISFVIYLIGTFRIIQPDYEQVSWGKWVDTGYFDLLSWQFIFVAGMMLGYLSYYKKLAPYLDRPIVIYVAIIVALLCFFHRNILFPISDASVKENILYWSSKKYLRLPRLLNIGAIFLIIRYLMVRNTGWFQYRPLVYLGRHSIEVFSFHIVLVILLQPFNPWLNHLSSFNLAGRYYIYPLETLFVIVVFAALFLAPPLWNIVSGRYQRLKTTLALKMKGPSV